LHFNTHLLKMLSFYIVAAIICYVLVLAEAGGPLHSHRFATKAVHAGCEPENFAGSVVPPISLSTTYIQSYPGVKPGMDDPNSHGGGFFYSRQANPNRGALERALATVEDAEYASAFSSGLAASQAVMQLLNAGDHVIALDDLYGGTSGMFRNIITPSHGVSFSFMNLDNIEAVEAACTPKTKMIWLESPTNPLLKTTDIRSLAALAKKKGLLFATGIEAWCRYRCPLPHQVCWWSL
jgi:cystathionine gamma-lyase